MIGDGRFAARQPESVMLLETTPGHHSTAIHDNPSQHPTSIPVNTSATADADGLPGQGWEFYRHFWGAIVCQMVVYYLLGALAAQLVKGCALRRGMRVRFVVVDSVPAAGGAAANDLSQQLLTE